MGKIPYEEIGRAVVEFNWLEEKLFYLRGAIDRKYLESIRNRETPRPDHARDLIADLKKYGDSDDHLSDAVAQVAKIAEGLNADRNSIEHSLYIDDPEFGARAVRTRDMQKQWMTYFFPIDRTQLESFIEDCVNLRKEIIALLSRW